MTHPLFEIVQTSMGVTSIKNKVVGEIMHNPVGPWAEANALYIDQSRLRERLTGAGSSHIAEELVVFDVGLGAAANAVATLSCARSLKVRRPLRLISFEVDLELLEFTLLHAASFDHLQGFEEAIETLLRKGEWTEEGITWQLRHGDFVRLIQEETHSPHLIFYDPYSPKKNEEMWSSKVFGDLREKCANEEGTLLLTYSRATPIRVALLNAGFFVGVGLATGLKDETTQAATQLTQLSSPLDAGWLERWKRSHRALPLDAQAHEEPKIREQILAHEQFKTI